MEEIKMSNDALKTQDSSRVTRFCSQRGAAYLEFAMVLPFFLVFVMGIVEFGRGFNIYHNLTNACREGARQAAQQDANQVTLTAANEVRNRMVNYMSSLGLQTSYYTGTGVNSSSTNYVYGTYPSGAYMLINQGEVVPQKDASGNVLPGGNYYVTSKVELHYPYSFPFFSRVIRLLLPSTAFDGTFYIGNSATMQN